MLKGSMIEDVFHNDEAASPDNQLVAGTAWFFSISELDSELDFLFIFYVIIVIINEINYKDLTTY